MTFVTHLECTGTGKRYDAGRPYNLSEAGKPLFARYDLAAVAKALTKDELAARRDGLWRFRELLPVQHEENRISLGEVISPIIRTRSIARKIGSKGELFIKDESRQPSYSFKARGLALAVSMAKELGFDHVAMPTNGNAGGALAAYAKRAGMRATVFCPDDTPEANVNEAVFTGARVYRVNGLINHCGAIVAEGRDKVGWFDVSTLKEPYRVEGKKTAGLEIAEQFGWELPDAIIFPAGGGTLLIGCWKAFDELEAMGWIGSKRPKMIAAQAAGCAPIVEAWETGATHARVWENAHTKAAGIRVPGAVADFLMLDAIRKSDGFAIAVPEEEIFANWREICAEEGLMMCPEDACAFSAYKMAVEDGRLGQHDRVLMFSCATGLKYTMRVDTGYIDRSKPVDFSQFA